MIRRWLDRWALRRSILLLHEACGARKNAADLTVEATLWALYGDEQLAWICLAAAEDELDRVEDR